jgi:hypothetical protein
MSEHSRDKIKNKWLGKGMRFLLQKAKKKGLSDYPRAELGLLSHN